MSDTSNVTSLAEIPGTVIVAEIVQTARDLGVQRLPDAERLVAGRVWPGGHGWVAEVGDGNSLRALDDMYESMDDAINAVTTEIRQLRDTTVNTLLNSGDQAAALAATRPNWQPSVLQVYADNNQKEPRLLQLPA